MLQRSRQQSWLWQTRLLPWDWFVDRRPERVWIMVDLEKLNRRYHDGLLYRPQESPTAVGTCRRARGLQSPGTATLPHTEVTGLHRSAAQPSSSCTSAQTHYQPRSAAFAPNDRLGGLERAKGLLFNCSCARHHLDVAVRRSVHAACLPLFSHPDPRTHTSWRCAGKKGEYGAFAHMLKDVVMPGWEWNSYGYIGTMWGHGNVERMKRTRSKREKRRKNEKKTVHAYAYRVQARCSNECHGGGLVVDTTRGAMC
ncbi:hypothetical protein F5I97DRAFT_657550 [Phlebopus sp. FC_14]|nr:hypothetical protein F5I97DRAFT_657550 [Phlebopus sp. FC_14]